MAGIIITVIGCVLAAVVAAGILYEVFGPDPTAEPWDGRP
jgi:hypothetical protein